MPGEVVNIDEVNWDEPGPFSSRQTIRFDFSIEYDDDERKKLKKRIGSPKDKEQVIRYGTREISRLLEYIGLEDELARTSKKIFNSALETNLRNNYSIADLAAASVFAASKEEGFARLPSEVNGGSVRTRKDYLPGRVRLQLPGHLQVSSFGNIIYAPATTSGSTVRRLYLKMARDEMVSTTYQIRDESSFLKRYVSLLNLDHSTIESSMACIVRFEDQLNGKSHASMAAISLWYTADHLGLDCSLIEICLASGFNMQTVSMGKNSLDD